MSEHTGLEFAPPIAAFPKFTLDAPSSVIYNLYGHVILSQSEVTLIYAQIVNILSFYEQNHVHRGLFTVIRYVIFRSIRAWNWAGKLFIYKITNVSNHVKFLPAV